MMNEKLNNIVVSILIAYIGISWVLAFLLFSYEFLIGPMFNAFSPQVTSSYIHKNK
jgi:hypothetical protein